LSANWQIGLLCFLTTFTGGLTRHEFLVEPQLRTRNVAAQASLKFMACVGIYKKVKQQIKLILLLKTKFLGLPYGE